MLLRDGKARASRATPDNRRRTAIAARRSRSLGSPPKKAGWVRHHSMDLPTPGAIIPIPSRPASAKLKPRPIGLVQLIDDPLAQHQWSVLAQVIVEIAQQRHEREKFDPCCLCPLGQN